VVDPERTYSEAEINALNDNLFALLNEIHQGSLNGRSSSTDLLCLFHRRIFTGVRDFAGLHRHSGFGSDRVNFYGSLRSPHKDEVPALLAKILGDVERHCLEYTGQQEADGYDLACIQLAVKAHADLIGLQPFQDGNKRTSRAFMNWVLVRLDMRPIIFEATQQEYAACMVAYLQGRDFKPLMRLAVGLYQA
jgi:fido (protein-threonine AMPylation protein)